MGSLLRGATQSCGCLGAENRNRPRPAKRKHFLHGGQVFGKLTVTDPDRGNARKSRLVGAICECGTETEVLLGNLVNGRVKSCGCLRYVCRWDRNDPEWEWRRYLEQTYRITPEQYQVMLATQGGVCAICKRPPGEKRLHVDHDHACCPGHRTCGKCNRGLLCFSCNSMVGKVETFRQALCVYLNLGGEA